MYYCYWDYRKIIRSTIFCIFDNYLLRPPRNIGEIRRAIIHKKHIYFHCRSMLR